jgi:copper oxidase (laccase) domain-containing protein
MFDLPGFIATRLRLVGIGLFEDLARDTYAESENFYSYRRSVHRNEPDYGRQIAAIALL